MCGINGFVTKNNSKNAITQLTEDISEMNNLIIHRGPDDDGVFIDSHENHNIAMGMRRLSIIDLQSGKQPIFSDDKQIVIVFNGEIYNFLELKKGLKSQGVHFNTNSDYMKMKVYPHLINWMGCLPSVFLIKEKTKFI